MFDLILKGGHVLDPGQNVDRRADVAFAKGRVAALDDDIPAERAQNVVDVTDRLVTPGLIDLHTHVYWGGTSLGVNADKLARRSGTTTFVDAGSAGPGNFPGFRHHVIERSRVRILAYMNISFAGIFAFSKNVMVGENLDIRLCNPREVVAVAREHLEHLVGVKVRVGQVTSGSNGAGPFNAALDAADKLHMPLMTHLDYPPPGRHEIIEHLRKGDVLTHCFKPFPNAPIDGHRQIRADRHSARKRGVVFDIGHGMGSLAFETATAMLEQGFLPDVISSDVHTLCIHGPAYDLLSTLSKFLALGMRLDDVIRTATLHPAAAIGRNDLGSLAPGAIGDASVLERRPGRYVHTDSLGETITADEHLFCSGLVTAGSWWPSEETCA
ncbi:MAG: amidohydrolase/deacetylase family metallohydrolase [Geminicoccaceae bacterium]